MTDITTVTNSPEPTANTDRLAPSRPIPPPRPAQQHWAATVAAVPA
jgi:hypothetical protein